MEGDWEAPTSVPGIRMGVTLDGLEITQFLISNRLAVLIWTLFLLDNLRDRTSGNVSTTERQYLWIIMEWWYNLWEYNTSSRLNSPNIILRPNKMLFLYSFWKEAQQLITKFTYTCLWLYLKMFSYLQSIGSGRHQCYRKNYLYNEVRELAKQCAQLYVNREKNVLSLLPGTGQWINLF